LDYKGRVSPYLTNEPLLDLKLEDKIHRIKQYIPEAHIRINTNGDLLNAERLISLFNSGLDGIVVDCYDSVPQFKDMLNTINGAIQSMPEIALQPKFDFRKMPIKQRFVQIYDCSDYKKDSPYLTNYAGHVKRDIGIKLPLNRPCFAVFEQMYINYKGDAVLCCQDWGFQAVLGNVVNDRLLAIWNGNILEDYRQKLSKCGRSQLFLCSTCDSINNKDVNYDAR
jgi:MoaA/NifB/PqqE/SkfB family radical SAM enzyme